MEQVLEFGLSSTVRHASIQTKRTIIDPVAVSESVNHLRQYVRQGRCSSAGSLIYKDNMTLVTCFSGNAWEIADRNDQNGLTLRLRVPETMRREARLSAVRN